MEIVPGWPIQKFIFPYARHMLGICLAYATFRVAYARFQSENLMPIWHMLGICHRRGGKPTSDEDCPNRQWHMLGICHHISIPNRVPVLCTGICLAYAIDRGGGATTAPSWSKDAGILLAYASTPSTPPHPPLVWGMICQVYAWHMPGICYVGQFVKLICQKIPGICHYNYNCKKYMPGICQFLLAYARNCKNPGAYAWHMP